MFTICNTSRKTITAVAIVLLCAVSSTQVAAEVITTDTDFLALYAGKSIRVGKNSSIYGDIAARKSISTGKGVSLNSIFSEDYIWLDQKNTVRGTVLANKSAKAGKGLDFLGASWSGKKLPKGAKGTVTGSVDTFDLSALPETPDKSSYGSQNISKGANTVTTLEAGAYKLINLRGKHATLNLYAGEYTIRKFRIANNGTVNIDTSEGDVILDVHKNFSTGNDVTFITSGNGEFTINLYDNDIQLGHNNAITGYLKAWDGNFRADHDLDLAGAIWASNSISLAENSAIYFQVIPEPATVALIITGGSLMILRHRRRHG